MIQLPPVRSLILPDEGYVLVEGDFDRADAQIVAWSADEPELKQVFQAGHDIYSEEGAWVYRVNQVSPPQRQAMKSAIHLTDYGGKGRTLASTLGTTVARAEQFQERWFSRFPRIPRWHQRTAQQLKLTHHIRNVWGFRRWYFDLRRQQGAINTDAILPQALAWLGQSGVSVAINKAMLRVHRELPEAQLLLQVHDSLLMQVPQHLAPAIFSKVVDTMHINIPFDDPLTIPVSLKWSASNWGEMEKWEDGRRNVVASSSGKAAAD